MIATWKKRAQHAADDLRTRSRFVDLAATILTRPNYGTDTLLASYVAMRMFVLVFPLAYVVIAGIGIYASQAANTPDSAAADVGLTGAIATSVAEAARGSTRGHGVVLLAGLVLAVMAGRGAVRAIRLAHASVWRLPVPKLSIVEPGGPLCAAFVLAMAWLGVLVTRLRSEGAPIVLTSIAYAAIVGLGWLEISWRLPHGVERRRDLLPGAVVVGLGAPMLNLATQLYFAPKLDRATTTYGVLGASLVFLTFLLVVAWTVVAGAEVNAGVHEWRHNRRER